MANNRRDRGDGSVRKRPDGRWEGRYAYTDETTGKRVDKSVYAPSQAEAKRKLKELIKQHEYEVENADENDDYVKPSGLTVGEWLDVWMKEYKKNSVRPATYSSYTTSIKTHIKPALGDMELQKLRPDHIQTMMNDLSRGNKQKKKNPLAPWTVLKAKNVLSGALEQAIRNQIIPYNPVKASVPPKLEQKEIRVLTEDEQKIFMEAVKGHRLEALYVVVLATGMRRGEILGLTWDCIDWNNNTILVKGAISRVKDPDTGITALRYAEPKTKSGRRQIPILPNLIPVLKAHKERQDAEKAEAGSAWNKQNLVFCSNVGTPLEPRRLATTMDKLTKKVGLPHFTFHALRHTFATRMLEANVPAKVVQDVLGHADVTLTLNTYSHVIGTTAHDQMEKINGLFGEAEKNDDKAAGNGQTAKAEQPAKTTQVKQQTSKKPSLKDKMDDAKKKVVAADKKNATPQKKMGDRDL